MYKPIQGFTGAVIKYQVAANKPFKCGKKIFKTSHDEMLNKLKEPDVRSIKILEVKFPANA